MLTLGHSNHTPESFLALVKQYGVSLIVDTRSQPYSRYAPHFNRETLSQWLATEGIGYLFVGGEMGGKPDAPQFYDEAGYVLYGRIAETEAFQTRLNELGILAQTETPALLCGEEDPTHCHRRRLVGRALAGRGVAVHHIRGDGSLQTEADLEFAQTQGQTSMLSLLAEEEPSETLERTLSHEWKSSQSVSRKRPPSDFSPY